MRKRKIKILSVILASMLLLTACSPKDIFKKEDDDRNTEEGPGDEFTTQVHIYDETSEDDTAEVYTEEEYSEEEPTIDQSLADPSVVADLEEKLMAHVWQSLDVTNLYGYIFTDKHTVVQANGTGVNDLFSEGSWYIAYCDPFGYTDEPDDTYGYRLGGTFYGGYLVEFNDEGHLLIRRDYDDDYAMEYKPVDVYPVTEIPESASNPSEFVEVWQFTDVGGSMDALNINNTVATWYTITADGIIHEDGPYGESYYHWECDDTYLYWCDRKRRDNEMPYPYEDARYSIKLYKYEIIDTHKILLTNAWSGEECWLQCR